MKKILIFLILITLVSTTFSQITKKVLFIGNSYTYANDLPNMVNQMAKSTNDLLIYDSRASGGFKLETHSKDQFTLQKIKKDKWDYVIIQAQSQELSWGERYNRVNQYPYIKTLYNKIIENRTESIPLFFMTWGRKNGDQSNCKNFPWVCTYEQMDDVIKKAYLNIAKHFSSKVTPVSVVWRKIREKHPKIELFSYDGSHPSEIGSYAAACSFYTMIFEKDPCLIKWNSNISEETTAKIKQIVKQQIYLNKNKWDFTHDELLADFHYKIQKDMVVFTNTSSEFDECEWEFGDGLTSVSKNTTHLYNSTGKFKVKLKLKRGIKEAEITKTINIEELLDIDVDFTYSIKGKTIQFKNTSKNCSKFYWQFGDKNTCDQENPTHTYSKSKNYKVTLLGMRGLRSITVEKFITIKDTQETNVDFNYSIIGAKVVFTNKSDNYESCTWDFGDGTTSNEESPNHTYNKEGNYKVKLTIKKEGKLKIKTLTVSIKLDPIADFSHKKEGKKVVFVNKSKNYKKCKWIFGDGNTTDEINKTHTYKKNGEYNVSLIVFKGIKKDTKEKIIKIESKEIYVNFTYLICNGEVKFTNKSKNYDSCKWFFGDNEISTEINPKHKFKKPGKYTVKLEVTFKGRTKVYIQNIKIEPLLSVNLMKKDRVKVYQTSGNCINIKLDKQRNSIIVSIFNLSGICFYKNIFSNQSDIQIIKKLKKGVYTIRIETKDYKLSRKILIIK